MKNSNDTIGNRTRELRFLNEGSKCRRWLMDVHIGDTARRSEGSAEPRGLRAAVDPLQPSLICIIYKDPVRTAQ
jgi:hypothetical protein